MKKISLTIRLNEIDKSKIVERTFTTRDGNTVTNKEYKLELVPLKEEKFVSQGDTWTLIKTHFLAEPQTKEEREAKVKSRIIGDGMEFRNKENPAEVGEGQESVNMEEVPF